MEDFIYFLVDIIRLIVKDKIVFGKGGYVFSDGFKKGEILFLYKEKFILFGKDM